MNINSILRRKREISGKEFENLRSDGEFGGFYIFYLTGKTPHDPFVQERAGIGGGCGGAGV
jgi:hypothetical protein